MIVGTALNFLILAVAVSAGSDVVDLGKDTYHEYIQSKPLALLEYFAPWCGHCKSLAPEYEKAATALFPENIGLAKVDCTVENDLCTSEGVQGFPTLKVWRDGKSSEYKGPRTAEGIISFMKKQNLPSLSKLATEKELSTFTTIDNVVLVFVGDESSAHYKVYETIASKLRESAAFGYFKGDAESITMYRSFAEPLVYSGDFDASSLETFIKDESIPLMGEIGPDNYSEYVDRGLPILYFFYGDAAQKDIGKAVFEPIALQFKGKMSVVYIDAVKFGGHASSMNLEQSWPAVAISEPSKNTKFPYTGEFTIPEVEKYVSEYLTGTLTPSLKSQPIPEDEGPVKILVGKNYADVVNDASKDVFVEFYAPWCGHCKKLSPVWDSLASQLSSIPEITIAKMDATENDLPLDTEFEIKGFPTLKLFKAVTNEIIDYSGDRSFDDLFNFLKKSAYYSSKLPGSLIDHLSEGGDHEHAEL